MLAWAFDARARYTPDQDSEHLLCRPARGGLTRGRAVPDHKRFVRTLPTIAPARVQADGKEVVDDWPTVLRVYESCDVFDDPSSCFAFEDASSSLRGDARAVPVANVATHFFGE